MGRADWEGNPHRGEPGSDTERLELAEKLGLLHLVDEEQEIRPGVTVYSAPGESPGHVIVRIESAGEVLYIVGDLFHHAAEVEHTDWAPPHADHTPLMDSRKRWYDQLARERALVVTAHERFPPWGEIIAANGGYRWQRSENS
jgi:glyoxylase-like metal-dependent hydrolase (beta-lactamase superfamily II)